MMAVIIEATEGKTRDKPITQKLRGLLVVAADAAAIETVLVTSGGQAAKGSGGKRTGSTRHDNGNAADLQLLKGGRALDFTLSADRPIIEAFVTSAAANGATGIGAGIGYMGPNTLHIGFGSKSIWGAGGKSANAPSWLKQAVFTGWSVEGGEVSSDGTHLVDEDETEDDQLRFAGEALPLSDGDVLLVAGYLGCQVATLRAVIDVESSARAFGPDGRPTILNEPHVFWRELGAGANREQAAKSGLAYKKQGTEPYPKTQAERYAWLEKAMAIDETAALRSCSWGIGQVMGFDHGLCGFNTVQTFVRAMTKSEGAQLYAMARFIVSNGLQNALRTRDWPDFARGYNGENFAKLGYDTKLTNAYDGRPASEKVTPPPAAEADVRAALVDTLPDDKPIKRPADDGTISVNAERHVVNARDGLNLRAGNSTDFAVLKTLPFGTEIFVLARKDDWAQVDLEGDGKADGFVLASLLRRPGAIAEPRDEKPKDRFRLDDQLADLLSDFFSRLRR